MSKGEIQSAKIRKSNAADDVFHIRVDAGHDYGTIETKGYRKLLVEAGGKPQIVDNPKWK